MNNKGIVLILVMWIFLILSLIAWGLGRRSSMEISLMQTYRGKVRSYAAARAGLNTVLYLLQNTPASKDTLYSSGIAIDQTKTPEDIFSHIDTGPDSYAIVQFKALNYNTSSSPQMEYGPRDEEGCININAIGIYNYQILSALFQLQGLSQSDADRLALSVVAYTGTGVQAGDNNALMNMNDSVVKPKNKRFENILELLEVNGMTKGIFDKIKNDITVYGDVQSGLWINTDTASNNVIQAVANATQRVNPSANASTITNEAYSIRDGADVVSFTVDDGVSSVASLSDANWPASLQEGISHYYRIRVVGVDTLSSTRTMVEAVVHQTQGVSGEIVSWQRD